MNLKLKHSLLLGFGIATVIVGLAFDSPSISIDAQAIISAIKVAMGLLMIGLSVEVKEGSNC